MGPYHDIEWGVPVHDDRRAFRAVGAGGGPGRAQLAHRVEAAGGVSQGIFRIRPCRRGPLLPRKVEALLKDTGIIRNRQKVESTVGNAAALLRVQEEAGSFDAYMWGFIGGSRVVNHWKSLGQVPATTPSRKRSVVTFDNAGSDLWGQPSATRTCSPPDL